MRSVNRHHPLRVRLKVIKTSKLTHKHNLNPEPSHLHQMITPHHTTRLILNNVLHTTTTISNSTVFPPLRKVNKMALHLKDPIVVMVDPKLREQHLNHRLHLNKLSHVSHLLERVNRVATPPLILPLKPRLQVLAKVLNLNLATHNSHKAAAIHMDILTTPALIMLSS